MSSRSVDSRIGAAALIVSGGVLLSRVLGVLRDVVFAGLLGADASTDTWVAAFRIPDFMNYLLAGGFLSITFIPIFSRFLADDDEEGGWEALAAVIRPVGIAVVALIVIGMAAAPALIEWLYPDFTADQLAATVRYTRIALPAQLFFVLGALLTAVQYSRGVFLIPTIAPIVYNLGIITGGVAWRLTTGEAAVEGFVWGVLGGAFVGNFAIQLWGARRIGMRLPAGTRWGHPVLREYLAVAIPLMIGQSIVVLDETFMSIFGDRVGDGAQTQLQLARRTMFVPIGVVAQAAGVAAYPFLARLHAEGREGEMDDTVDRTLRVVVVLSMAATAVLMALSVPVIRVLFERGRFDPADTAQAAVALLFYAFAVPIWGALQIITRGFYARLEMWTPVLVGTAMTVVAVPVYWAMSGAFEIRGVAAASVVVLGAYTVVLAGIWYRRAGIARAGALLDGAIRALPVVVTAGLAAFGAARLIDTWIGTASWTGSLVAVLAGSAAFAGTGLLAAAALYEAERLLATEPGA